MMKRLFFKTAFPGELRVSLVEGEISTEIGFASPEETQRKGNIYQGVIARIEPELQACFVNYGEERHGFLPFREIAPHHVGKGRLARCALVEDGLREGQEILVQVEQDEQGEDGANLTSFIALIGRYVILRSNRPQDSGGALPFEDMADQEQLYALSRLNLPAGMALTLRPSSVACDTQELQWDVNYLLQLWRAIEDASRMHPAPFLIYEESSLVIRAIRDHFGPEIAEILIDNQEIYEQARQYVAHVMPDMLDRVKFAGQIAPLVQPTFWSRMRKMMTG